MALFVAPNRVQYGLAVATQEQIVNSNMTGSRLETERAIEYILGFDDYDYCYNTVEIYEEEVLKSLIDDGNIVVLSRGLYDQNAERIGGHSTVLYDYYEIEDVTFFKIYDPLSVNVGSRLEKTYVNICNGQNRGYANEQTDNWIWDGVVVFKIGDYFNTIHNDKLP